MIKNRYFLPLVPLRGVTVFPDSAMHFDVGRPKSIAAVRFAMETDKLVFLCCQKDIDIDQPGWEHLCKVGVIAEIKQILNLPDGNVRILVEGIARGKITRFQAEEQLTTVHVVRCEDILCDNEVHIQVMIRRIFHLMEDYLDLYDRLNAESLASLLSVENPGSIADIIASNLPLNPQDKQQILDELSVEIRLRLLIDILTKEVDLLKLEREVMDKVQENMDENQREYMLREKLHVVQEELGEGDSVDDDVRKYRTQIAERNLPKIVEEKLDEEISRMEKTHPYSQEYGVIQGYIETVLSLPWDKSSEDCLDIVRARYILDRDHCGLDKVKERILEYLAVRKLSGKPKSNILCLVGPPGVGKTSVVRSLAEALGRKYARISLGGVQNEAEIRGHRKTYVAAMPGRVIEALKQAEVNNPLMLFDEIDKMSRDYSGDPASAMLEVFDPEQNKNFRDHYVELPFDLSDVIFFATANTLETIPRPLLDRMDVIEISGYTPEEKIQIAKQHLIPKQRKLHGLKATQFKISPSVLPLLIEHYTHESGVRSLERQIAALCRKAAVEFVKEEPPASVSVTRNNLTDYLGKYRYHYDKTEETNQIGAVNGLAWTELGGDTLCVEANTMPGTGKLELTGNLGDVMQESAKAALSYVRANAFRLGIDTDFYKKTDIHIHVPEGAIPKDGPSAGVTMATALVSALTETPVNRLVAMTGEITLRGKVLPIGGLKEKSLAAYRMGIKTVIIPKKNKPDYDELPEKIRNSMKYVFAEEIGDVLKTALIPVEKRVTQAVRSDKTYREPLLPIPDAGNTISATRRRNSVGG